MRYRLMMLRNAYRNLAVRRYHPFYENTPEVEWRQQKNKMRDYLISEVKFWWTTVAVLVVVAMAWFIWIKELRK